MPDQTPTDQTPTPGAQPEDAAATPLSESDLAERAGASVDQIRALVDAGVIVPGEGATGYRLGDVKRIRLVRACEQAGMPLEGIARAIAGGRLSFAFLDMPYIRWAPLTSDSFADVAARKGMAVDVAQRLYEACGLPRPDPDAPAREDDVVLVDSLSLGPAMGLDETVMVRAMRLYGENIRRIARGEAGLYHSTVETPLLESGLSDREMREVASQLSMALVPGIERMLMTLYHRQQEHFWIEDMVEHIEGALADAGLGERRNGPPPAMCFLDLAGYTRLTEERGDNVAAELATTLALVVQGISQEHGGTPVKWLGDGVMFHFLQPRGAVAGALRMVGATPRAGLPPAHVGVSAGPVVQQDGDYFGRTVNIAARVAGAAKPGQVLVTPEVVAGGAPDGVAFRELGATELKGVVEPVVLYEAVPA